MNTTDAGFYLDSQSLSGLKQRAQLDQRGALREVAGQFEALFLQMMLKSMRDATPSGDLFASEQSDYYREMLDKQMASDLSVGGSIGLADLLVRQLDSTLPNAPRPAVTAEPPAPVQEAAQSASGPTPAAIAPAAVSRWSNPSEFVQALYPHARQAAEKLGVDPAVLVAQSALETGWGRRVAEHADGRNSFALFGIKADDRWDGERVTIETLEFEGDRFQPQRAAFRAYASVAEAMNDYADFIAASPRYQAALSTAAEPEQYLHGLQQAGYATDPNYADKILTIYRGERLQQGLAPAQVAATDAEVKLNG